MKLMFKKSANQANQGAKIRSEKQLFLLLSIIMACLLVCTQLLEAAPPGNYNTTRDGPWNDPNTWDQNAVPDSTTNVTIEHDVTLKNGKTAICNNLNIGFNKFWFIVWILDYGNVQVEKGAEMVVKGNINQLQGNGLASNVNNSLDFASNSTLILRGNQQQKLPDQSIANLENVVIQNKASKKVTPQSSITINGTLDLKENSITSSHSNLLLIGANGQIKGVTPNSHIKGPFFFLGQDVMGFHKKVNSQVKRLHIKNATKTDQFSVAFKNQSHKPNQLGAGLNQVSNVEHCQINPQFNLPNNKSYKVKLFWENQQQQGITDTQNLVVAHYNNGNWLNEGKSQVTLNADSSGSITSGTVSSFSPFTFGSTSSSQSLPVELVSFQVKEGQQFAKLFWVTASETQNSHFMVQRSTNGQDFKSIEKVQGSGTTTENQEYEFLDKSPQKGTNYFRLKQVDLDGSFQFSDIKSFYWKTDSLPQDQALSINAIKPNPFQSDFRVKYQLKETSQVDLYFTNIEGKMIAHKRTLKHSGTNVSKFNNFGQLAPGIYYLTIMTEKSEISRKVFKH